MRFEKAENLLRLAILMQTKDDGVSLIDIQDEFDVGRRTAERMRDSVQRLIPSMHSCGRDGRIKKWKISENKFNSLVNFNSDELAEIKTSAQKLKEAGLDNNASLLEEVYKKIKSTIPLKETVRLEPDIEAIIEAEGYAMRTGPRIQISNKILSTLRESIKACKKVKITYTNNEGTKSSRTIAPYGFLYGNRHYIIAMCSKAEGLRTFNLTKISKATFTDASFEVKSNFSLKDYNERSFGVFQEEPYNIVWEVKPEAVEKAKNYQFHPSQQFKENDDGTLTVSFKAGGLQEMCYELFKWHGSIKVVEPQELKDEFKEMVNCLL